MNTIKQHMTNHSTPKGWRWKPRLGTVCEEYPPRYRARENKGLWQVYDQEFRRALGASTRPHHGSHEVAVLDLLTEDLRFRGVHATVTRTASYRSGKFVAWTGYAVEVVSDFHMVQTVSGGVSKSVIGSIQLAEKLVGKLRPENLHKNLQLLGLLEENTEHAI